MSFSSDFDADGIMREVYKAANEQYAVALADAAQKQGVTSAQEVDELKFDLSAEQDGIDIPWIERRAREILRGRLR